VEETFFDYDLLHQGFIRAIISRIGSEAGISATYWQADVCVYEKTTRGHALIEQEMHNEIAGKIRVQTQVGQAAALLDKMSELVEEEQTKIGLTLRNVSRQVPRRGEVFRAEGMDEAFAKEERLLEYGNPPPPKPRYYVSYAWSDEGKYREAIVDQVCDEAEKRGTPILRDKKVLEFGDSIENEGHQQRGSHLCHPGRQISQVAILHVRAIRDMAQ
jgi:internalin A